MTARRENATKGLVDHRRRARWMIERVRDGCDAIRCDDDADDADDARRRMDEKCMRLLNEFRNTD